MQPFAGEDGQRLAPGPCGSCSQQATQAPWGPTSVPEATEFPLRLGGRPGFHISEPLDRRLLNVEFTDVDLAPIPIQARRPCATIRVREYGSPDDVGHLDMGFDLWADVQRKIGDGESAEALEQVRDTDLLLKWRIEDEQKLIDRYEELLRRLPNDPGFLQSKEAAERRKAALEARRARLKRWNSGATYAGWADTGPGEQVLYLGIRIVTSITAQPGCCITKVTRKVLDQSSVVYNGLATAPNPLPANDWPQEFDENGNRIPGYTSKVWEIGDPCVREIRNWDMPGVFARLTVRPAAGETITIMRAPDVRYRITVECEPEDARNPAICTETVHEYKITFPQLTWVGGMAEPTVTPGLLQ